MKKSNLFSLILIIVLNFYGSTRVFAQVNETVTITVSGEGNNQNEAQQNALRSAMEQVFGAFISTKTEILNDALVKDEVVSIANGNIQKFTIISETKIPDGDYVSTLSVTVSVTKLTSFIENKGFKVEFKGGLFAINIKQQILNEESEVKAINNLVEVLKKIADKSFDFEIIASEPKSVDGSNNSWQIPLTVNVKMNSNFKNIPDYLTKTLAGISLSKSEKENYYSLKKDVYQVNILSLDGEKYYNYYFRKFSSIEIIQNWIDSFRKSLTNFNINDGNSTRSFNQFNSHISIDNFAIQAHEAGNYVYTSFLLPVDYQDQAFKRAYYLDSKRPYVDETKDKFPGLFKQYAYNPMLMELICSGLILQFNKLTDKKNIVIQLQFSDIRTLDEITHINGYSVHPINK